METDIFDVDILITFYNQEQYVDRTFDSVLSQNTIYTYRILAGDDGSKDGTVEKLREWKKKYPTRIEIFENENHNASQLSVFCASHNRVRLLHQVRAKYFMYLDGDDYYCDVNKLQKQIDALEKNISCIACGHRLVMEYPDGTKIPMNAQNNIYEGIYSFKDYWKKIYCSTDSLLVRSNVISKLPLELLNNQFDDELITFSVLCHGNIYYFPDDMVVYYQTGDGVWNAKDKLKNAILSVAMYDMCNKINPKFKMLTTARLRGIWRPLLAERHSIVEDTFKGFEEEAHTKRLRNTIYWTKFHGLSVVKKTMILINTCRIIVMGKIYSMLF